MNNRYNKFLLLVIIVLAVIIAVLVLKDKKISEFKKPEFEEYAVNGRLENISKDEINSIKIDEKYIFELTSKLILEKNNELPIYLYSNENNDVYIKLEVYDKEGKCILKTGVIKPDQTLKSIYFDNINDDDEFIFKIKSYDSTSYYSRGVVKLKAKVQRKEDSK